MKQDGSNIAILVIDLQKDYFHIEGKMSLRGHGVKHLDKTVKEIEFFLNSLKNTSVKIIWTQMDESRVSINPKLRIKRAKDAGLYKDWEQCIPGTEGYELLLKPSKSDLIFPKNDEDIFSNTEIEKYLRTNNINKLVFIGGYTHRCIKSSVWSALDKGFKPIVIENLIDTPKDGKKLHAEVINLFKQNSKITVLKSDKFLNNLLSELASIEYQKYFGIKSKQILETLKSYNKTKSGLKNSFNIKSINSYSDFAKIPTLSPKKISQNPYSYVNGDVNEFIIKRTSGTTGKPRLIFHDPKTRKATFNEKFTNFLFSHKDELLVFHRKADVTSNFMIDGAIRNVSQDIKVAEFANPEEGIKFLLDNADKTYLYIPELTTVWRRFAYYLEHAIDNGTISKQLLKKEFVNLEFTGEYMNLDELAIISKQAEKIFGIEPEITVCYGMTEQSGIGVYLYDKNDEEMLYKVKENKFVEVINKGKPVIDQDGQIVVTQLDWNTGTILPRYNTEDIGRLTFKDGIPYLKVYPRELNKGWFSISTNNYNASLIVSDIEKRFDIVFQAEFQVIDTKDCREVLLVKMFSPSFINSDLIPQVEERIVDMIFEQLSKASQEYVKIKFYINNDFGVSKRWSLKKKEKTELNFADF